MKKTVTIGIVCLIVGLMSFPTIGTSKLKPSTQSWEQGDTLYVGGTGPNNYSIIQHAVDNASNGDTVFVYNGIYSEYFPNVSYDYHACVDIKTSITLQGEEKDHTIINGSGRYDVISIHANNVIITGFTIQHGGTPETNAYGRGIHNPGWDNLIITDTIIVENKLGFLIYYDATDIQIFNNSVHDNEEGITIWNGATAVDVYDNDIFDNNNGVTLEYNIDQCYIHHNMITDNGRGVYLSTLGENIIEYNHIEHNNRGISAVDSKGTIQYNNIINNTNQAIVSKAVTLLTIPLALRFRQQWNNNYWSDWDSTEKRPIDGYVELYIIFWLPHFPTPIPIPVKIGQLPTLQYDRNPVIDPYDIT